MPYIDKEQRELYKSVRLPRKVKHPGVLNYIISNLIQDYIENLGGYNYRNMNEVIGVLDCTKEEFRRRKLDSYEDRKIRENGDVYC